MESAVPLASELGVVEGDVIEDVEEDADDVKNQDVDDENVDDEDDVEDAVLELVSALVMLKRSVAESVTVAPSSHTAIAKTGEAERSLRVPTIHEKLVAPTWSSETVSAVLEFLPGVLRVINSMSPASSGVNFPSKLAARAALTW
jgi:hypothetical protein